MTPRPLLTGVSSLLVALLLATCVAPRRSAPPSRAEALAIPRVWDDAILASLELPLSNPAYSPRHVSADYYYRIPVRTIYKNYPVYAPGREPAGYIDWLKEREPITTFDAAVLKTETDWIRAGEIVFDAPITTERLGALVIADDLYVRDPTWHEAVQVPVAADGTLPFFRYVVAEKGKVQVGILACGMCHTRVMPDGSVIKGAQGNFQLGRAMAYDYRRHVTDEQARALERLLYTNPWVKPPPGADVESMTIADLASAQEAIPSGVLARHRTSPFAPVQVPDLIGVRDRKYLDRTGLQQHRSIADLMRYAALNQGGDDLAQFGDFCPLAGAFGGQLPEPSLLTRYSDEQLYALAMFVYSLRPPPNPHKFDEEAARGQVIFEEEGCARCHTPPLYTNNKLTPATGFTIPEDHREKYAILERCVETDPQLTLKTRRGTGYYKVPSLKGVWYRGPLEHSGSVATLEDWFDPRRLRDDLRSNGLEGTGRENPRCPRPQVRARPL